MELKRGERSKGGRPVKAVRRDQLLGVKCTTTERQMIISKAQTAGLTVSEYLRELGLTTRISGANKALPREVLELTGTLNHLAANVNQIAHKRNREEVLNAYERAMLNRDADKLRELAGEIKKHFQ